MQIKNVTEKLKPCPFCGNTDKPFSRRFKRDKRKVFGEYFQICILKCGGCTCQVSQAGIDKEAAERNVIAIWNRRAGR